MALPSYCGSRTHNQPLTTMLSDAYCAYAAQQIRHQNKRPIRKIYTLSSYLPCIIVQDGIQNSNSCRRLLATSTGPQHATWLELISIVSTRLLPASWPCNNCLTVHVRSQKILAPQVYCYPLFDMTILSIGLNHTQVFVLWSLTIASLDCSEQHCCCYSLWKIV